MFLFFFRVWVFLLLFCLCCFWGGGAEVGIGEGCSSDDVVFFCVPWCQVKDLNVGVRVECPKPPKP